MQFSVPNENGTTEKVNENWFQIIIADSFTDLSGSNECQVTPVIHVLQYPGCVPKPIPSFACIGRCASYLQVMLHLSYFTFWRLCPYNNDALGFW